MKSLFNKVKGLRVCSFIKKRLQHRYFPVKFEKFLKSTFFYKIPLVAASEEQVAGEVGNFPCLYDKGNRTAKKIRKRIHGLGWRMPAAMTMIHKLNHKGNLDWFKRCSEIVF